MSSLKKYPYRYFLFGLLFIYSFFTPAKEILELVHLKQPFFSRNWTLLTPTALVFDRFNFFSYSVISLWNEKGNLLMKKPFLSKPEDYSNYIDGKLLSKLVTGSFYDDRDRIIGHKMICKHLIPSLPENVHTALVEYHSDVKDAFPRKLEVNCAREN